MIQAISQYTQSIAMIIIFTSIINLIMPSGNFQKYIKMVLGLIVIITILAPINTLIFKNKPDYTDILKRYETDIESTSMKKSTSMQIHSGQYLEAQKEIILDSYKEKLIPQMTDIIEKSDKVAVTALNLGFDEDIESAKFGTITTINMTVSQVEEERNKKIIKVPKIKVGTKQIQSYSGDQVAAQIEEKIKTCLIDFYNLSSVNINIIVQKNS